MIASDTRKLLYLAPPKTGTCSVNGILQQKPFNGYVVQPDPHAHHNTRWMPKFKNYYIFITVRHPYSRMVSLWRFCQREIRLAREEKEPNRWEVWWEANFKRAGIPDFATFLHHQPFAQFFHGVWSCYWHVDQLKRRVNKVVYHERFEQELREIPGFEGLDIPHVNPGPPSKRPWYDYYDPGTVLRVQELWGRDFDRFGYEKRIGEVKAGKLFA